MMRRATLAAALAAAALLPAAAPAEASPYIHAHRGGPITEGTPAFGENTLAAFEAAAEAGFVLEMDAKLTADGVPVVIHDATLDRTTDCSGEVRSKTLAELDGCRVDILGTSGNFVQLAPGDPRLEPIPTVTEALELARDAGVTVNLEIKNVPVVDPDFDPSEGFADAVVDAVIESGLPPSRLIVQSFWPANLNVVETRIPAADTSLLTNREINGLPLQTNEGGPAFADASGYEWVSPQWPPTGPVIAEAHTLGLQVVPWTLNGEAEVADAYSRGVDAVISDDPAMARRVIAGLEPEPPPAPPPPTDADCAEARAGRTAPPIEAYDRKPGAPRVFAIQFKQELRHVTSYGSFRTKIECLIRDYVLPRMASDRPNVVALNEDIGLMTIATGSRGAPAREIFGNPSLSPSCPQAGQPCGALGALATLTGTYAPQVAAYQARFAGEMQPVSSAFVAATDTFGRGWMQAFSDLAKRYGVYMLGSNNQSPFRESRDPSEIALFADPDLPAPDSVFVATEPPVYNEVFMWGPEDVRREGPRPLRNVVAQNKKLPLTPIEQQIQLTPGPRSGPDAVENVRPYALPGTGARISFATSLPAFIYDEDSLNSFGRSLTEGIDPCADVATYYMRCLDRLGTNLVMQDEANPGPWAGPAGEGTYQPLEWMRSTWRAVADPTVSFAYNVTPHMVGNLADIAFDGQTAITQRGLSGGPGCTYVGNSSLQSEDPERLRVYSGPKTEFLGISPWVIPDGPREELRETSARLAPGSGDPLENDYLETAIVADLPFPPDANRASCAGERAPAGGRPGPGGPPAGGPPGVGPPAGGTPSGTPTRPRGKAAKCKRKRAKSKSAAVKGKRRGCKRGRRGARPS